MHAKVFTYIEVRGSKTKATVVHSTTSGDVFVVWPRAAGAGAETRKRRKEKGKELQRCCQKQEQPHQH